MSKRMAEHETFLKKALAEAQYREQEKTKKMILETIKMWKGLKPITDSFVFNNGTSKKLVALKGTVPVRYKGNTYHIPVMIWLLDTHPSNAPMVYVAPTPEMRIKVSRHVDHNGKVYLPYLHDWKPNTSDLLLLIQVLILTFEEQPPVYAVPPGQQQQVQSPPFNPGAAPSPAAAAACPYPAYPAYPAYPGMGGAGMPMPMPMPGTTGTGAQPQPPSYGLGTTGMTSPQTTASQANYFRPSLVSAAEEKLKRRLEDMYVSTEIIRNTGQQLREGQTRLESMMRRLSEEKTALERNVETFQKECAGLDEKIVKSTSEDNSPLDIDDAIQPPAPLYKQILNTVAEEAALEDTIYYLGEAFRREQMDLETYIRHVRQLSRRQFLQRAMLRKSRQKAGLAG